MKTPLNALPIALAAALAALACRTPAPAQLVEAGRPAAAQHANVDKAGLALSGYDPVAYFPEGGSEPRKGKPELALRAGGATYRFATRENLELFQKSPARFEPGYGGWCAYAMVEGKKVEVDPKSYLIQGGRLMLFYKSIFNDTRATWGKKPTEYEASADQAWRRLVGDAE